MEADAFLVDRILQKSGLSFETRWVDNKKDYKSELAAFAPDIILSDHIIPSFTSIEALKLAKQANKHLPFILITGAIPEEFAVSMMKEGLDDYILKDRIQRLPTAIVNALSKASAEKDKELYFKEIISAEKKFRALIENISDAILLVSKTGIITYASPSVKRITGFDLPKLKGRPFFDFLHPDDQELSSVFFNGLVHRSKKTLTKVFRMIHRSKGYIWVEATISRASDSANGSSFIINYRDVTLRRESELRLQKSEANLRTIFDNTDMCYVLIDRNFNIISFNHSALLSYQKEMNVSLTEGRNIVKLMPASRRAMITNHFETVLMGEQVSYENSFPAKDSTLAWYQVNILPVRDETGQVLGLVICSEDISERKLTDLERDKMTADILRHNKNLEQFSYIVSHNLRAPVANILGLAGLIDSSINLSDADFGKCVDGLQQSAKKLDDVIIDLNYILQARRDINEKKEMVVFSVLVSDICTSINSLIEKEQVSIRTGFAANGLFTIKSYLHSIFLNLLTNSIKYRDPAIPTVIEISSRETKTKVIVTFSDNGLGIDMAIHKEKIFGLYKKFHNHKEGKGMGLYMVKTQVEILGGTIDVKSEVNKGTRFILEFEK